MSTWCKNVICKHKIDIELSSSLKSNQTENILAASNINDKNFVKNYDQEYSGLFYIIENKIISFNPNW